MGIRTNISLDDRIKNAEQDGPDILCRLYQRDLTAVDEVDILAELPAAVDVQLILAQVSAWSDLQKHLNKHIRIFAITYDRRVEKYVLGIVQHMDNISVTSVPCG